MAYKHGLHGHRIYGNWHSMKARCLNPNNKGYKHYGGRGIKVCERWLDIRNFVADMFPSYREGLEIDRIDVNGNYEPGNCRWVTRSGNNKNRRDKAPLQSRFDYVTFDKSQNRWEYKRQFKTQQEVEAFAEKLEALWQ